MGTTCLSCSVNVCTPYECLNNILSNSFVLPVPECLNMFLYFAAKAVLGSLPLLLKLLTVGWHLAWVVVNHFPCSQQTLTCRTQRQYFNKYRLKWGRGRRYYLEKYYKNIKTTKAVSGFQMLVGWSKQMCCVGLISSQASLRRVGILLNCSNLLITKLLRGVQHTANPSLAWGRV